MNTKTINEISWNKSIHKSYKTYLIQDNGAEPFLVAIKGLHVKIFRIDPKIDPYDDIIRKYHYNYLVKEYNAKKVFIGKSPKNKMTIYNGGYGRKFYGNSILLELPDEKYVYIGSEIYQFTPNNKIISYLSPIGHSITPLPFAINKDNVYFMLDKTYVPIKYLPKLNKTQMTDLYSYYYGSYKNIPLEKYAKKMNNVKIIQKRINS